MMIVCREESILDFYKAEELIQQGVIATREVLKSNFEGL